MSGLVVNESQKIAVKNLNSVAYNMWRKYYDSLSKVSAILNKMKLKGTNKLMAKETIRDLEILIKNLNEILKITVIEEGNLKIGCDTNNEYLNWISNKIEFTIFYIGKVAARLEISRAYQEDVTELTDALQRIRYNFFEIY